MSVFSITALDRLIESDRRSSASAATAPPSMDKQRDRRPLYVSYPYSSSTSMTSGTTSTGTASSSVSVCPPQPSSPSSLSPSPYLVNHKRRVPSGVGASQQNGFHVLDKSRPSESQQELRLPRSSTEEEKKGHSDLPSDGLHRGKPPQAIKEHSKSPQGHLTLHFRPGAAAAAAAAAANKTNLGNVGKVGDGEKNNNGKDDNKWRNQKYVNGKVLTIDEKAKGKRVVIGTGGRVVGEEGRDRKDMSSRCDDPRGKKKLEESEYGYECTSSLRESNASSSQRPADRSDAGPPSSSGSDEWFDAADGPLPECLSDDETTRQSLSDPGPSLRAGPDSDIIAQLEAEIQRRIAAEEARAALQLQRDGMAALLSSAGISLLESDVGDVKITEQDNMVGVSDSEAQRLMVTRYVAGAVATGAVRAEAEAELQTVLTEKSKEIARLKDKLQYYELVNHEMSHRNQESIENARQTRRRQQRRQRFIVFGLSAAICVGVSAAVIYHYIPWEDVMGLNSASTLLEGEQPNTESLGKVVDFGEPNPEN